MTLDCELPMNMCLAPAPLPLFLNRPDKRPAAACLEEEYYPFVLDNEELP